MSRELLFSVTKNDLDVQTFRAGKNGGQRGDKVETAVRIVHKESGAVGYCQDERQQSQNKKIAFRRMIADPKFELWKKQKVWVITQQKDYEDDLERQLEILMQAKYLKVEVRDENGEWYEQ